MLRTIDQEGNVMRFTKTIAAMLICAGFSISATAKSDTTDHDINAAVDEMEQALNNKDIQGLEDMYKDDAVVIPAESEIIEDKGAIVSFWNNKFSAAESRYHFDVIHCRVRKNVAHLSALWSATVITPDIQADVEYGFLTSVMERQQDGSWKIRVQNWN